MTMIPDEVVDEVRQAADIVQLIGEYVDLRRTGSDYRGPCPFHQGKHRNFSVSPKRERYYCFVCHEGGDVFDFARKRLGLDFVGAVKHVGQRFGVDVRENESRRQEPDDRERLWEANAAAADWFRVRLWEDDVGREARSYLEAREITREVADQFGLGFASRDADSLISHLHTLGFTDDVLLDAGLLFQREEDGDVRPRFRGRLIFPILDASGRHVGFGGRLLGTGEPKYLNSPESRVYSKARLLYGLNWAKNAIRRAERAILVEGYFDVLRVAASGLPNVVAPLGTSLTEEQAKLLRRYTTTAYLLYDGDAAGMKASFRAGDVLLREGFAVMVVSLPEGEDPDTFVRKHGAAALDTQLEAAVDVVERKIQELARRGYFGDLRHKRQALDKLIPTIRATADPLMRELYMSRIAEVADVGKQLLAREVGEGPDRGAPRRAGSANERALRRVHGGTPDPPASPRFEQGRYTRAVAAQGSERELVRVMLLQPSQVEYVVERIASEEFLNPVYRRIFLALLQHAGDGDITEVLAALDAEAAAVAGDLVEEGQAPLVDLLRTVDDAVARLRARHMDHEMWEIDLLLPLASSQEKDKLLEKKQALSAEKQQISGGAWATFGRPRT